jgi:hypothetical protein
MDRSEPRSGTAPQRLVASLFTVAVLALFFVSGGVLWELGMNYDGLAGATATKIHPATYLSVLTFALLAVARRNPAAFVIRFVTRYPGALALFLVTALLAATIVIEQRHGIAVMVDTYLLAIIVWVIAAELEGRDARTSNGCCTSSSPAMPPSRSPSMRSITASSPIGSTAFPMRWTGVRRPFSVIRWKTPS